MGDPELDAWAKQNEFKSMMQKYVNGVVIGNPTYSEYIDTEEERKDLMAKYAAAALYLTTKVSNSLK